MQPRIDHFVNRPQDKPFDQTDIEILADAAFLLSGFDNLRDEILVHLGHLPDLIFRQSTALMGFNLVHDGHVAVPLEFHEVTPDKVAQFVQAVVSLADSGAKLIKNLFCPVVEKLHQNIVFVLEIQVDGTVGHAGLPGDLGNGRLVESLAGKDRYGCLQDNMVLIIFFLLADFGPPAVANKIR